MKVILSAMVHANVVNPTTGVSVFEADELREQLRRTQLKCEELERDRDLNIAKANELAQVLEASCSDDKSLNQKLVQKTVEAAESCHEVRLLQSELSASNDRVKELERDYLTQHNVLVELSQIFRSVTGMANHNDILQQLEEIRLAENENSKEGDSFDFDSILTPQQALDLTLSSLREQIELLEDERQGFFGKIRGLRNLLEEQRRENEARELKILALEKQMEEVMTENAALKDFLIKSFDAIQVTESDQSAKSTSATGKKPGVRICSVARFNEIA